MRFREIVEGDAAGIIAPVAPDQRPEVDRYQTHQPRPKKPSRWQTPPGTSAPPVAPKSRIPSAEPARPHPPPVRP